MSVLVQISVSMSWQYVDNPNLIEFAIYKIYSNWTLY